MSLAEALEPPEEATDDAYDFEAALQAKIVALMLRDTSFLKRVAGLIEPDFFTLEADGHIARLTLDFFERFQKAPHPTLMKTVLVDYFDARRLKDKTLRDEIVARVLTLFKATDISDVKFVTEKVVEFAKDRAVGLAIIASIEDKEKKNYGAIRKRVEQALLVGIDDSEDDYDYYAHLEKRTEERKARAAGLVTRDGITTGYTEIDRELYHNGWGRKELSVMMGPAKSGKSTALGDFAKNASLAGLNVLFMSCEVSTKIIADRIDANISGVLMKKLDDDADAVAAALEKLEGKAGRFYIKEYATGTLKASMIRRVLERLRDKGVVIDLLAVDYADIMSAEHPTGDEIQDSKAIYVDLRAIAFDYDLACLTATQTNRGGAKKMTAVATDVAQDYNRVRIADVLITINSTEAERAANEARLFFAAVRNSESDIMLRIKQDRSRMRFIEGVLGRS